MLALFWPYNCVWDTKQNPSYSVDTKRKTIDKYLDSFEAIDGLYPSRCPTMKFIPENKSAWYEGFGGPSLFPLKGKNIEYQ